MSIHKKNNKIVPYVMILISFFIIVFFTKNEIFAIQETLDTKQILEKELSDKTQTLQRLNTLKKELNAAQSGSLSQVQKFSGEFKEEEFIRYLYNYIESSNSENNRVIVKSISMGDTKTNEMGFDEISITLNIRVSNERTMLKMLDFITKKDSRYNFFIDNFSYPNDGKDTSFHVAIPLRLFYK